MAYVVDEKDLAAVADSIRAKAGVTDALVFPDGFQSEIDGIKAASPEAKPNDVMFIDYDGKILYSYTHEEAAALTELPPLPEHDGLVCDGWNLTLDEVKADRLRIIAGALYSTVDDATEIELELPDGGDAIMLSMQMNGTAASIDWGDGESSTASGNTKVQIEHVYGTGGRKIIRILCDGLIGIGDSVNNAVYNAKGTKATYARLYVRRVSFGCTAYANGSAFYGAYAMKYITFPAAYKINSIRQSSFGRSGIRCLIAPLSITELGANALQSTSILYASIPYKGLKLNSYSISSCNDLDAIYANVATISGPQAMADNRTMFNIDVMEPGASVYGQEFRGCTSLARAVTGNIGTVTASMFYQCYNILVVDMTACESVPALSNANAFTETPAAMKILVPDAIADEWRTATNWTTYADKIVGV